MKQEVDALQIGAAIAARPWYRHGSVLIAVGALLLSFGTTFYSYKRSQQQDVHNARVELRELIQQLAGLPITNLELARKYARDPDARGQASSQLNTQNIVLAQQAVDVIDSIPDHVSASEFFAVASALGQSGDYGRTLDLYERALAKARDATDWAAASRSLGTTAFAIGDVKRARSSFQQALDVSRRFPTRNEYFRKTTEIYTELLWGQAELSTKHCGPALMHSDRAAALLSDVGRDQFTTQYFDQLAAMRERAGATCK